MQTTINTDVFIRNVLNTLMTQMDLWGESATPEGS